MGAVSTSKLDATGCHKAVRISQSDCAKVQFLGSSLWSASFFTDTNTNSSLAFL
jgi:hypothetical protein